MAKKILQVEPPIEGYIEHNLNSIFLNPIEEREIIDIVIHSKYKPLVDADNIGMTIVKNVIECASKPLTYIFSLSFQSGTVLQKMKIAKVIPLYKTGNKHLFTNYRPVSLLPQFSKVLEKPFIKNLDNFLDKYNILSENRYGFRTNRATSLALIDAIENITNALEQKHHTIGLFLDLKKTFDTIDHCILFAKLEKYGIRSITLDWVRSYVSKRSQYVKLGNVCFSGMEIMCKVPQFLVLGPKLFILYINDLCKVSKIAKLVLFADDTNV